MSSSFTAPLHFPTFYFLVAAGLISLGLEAWYKRLQSWAVPAVVLYLTVLTWYFADLFIRPEDHDFTLGSLLNISHGQVAAFPSVCRFGKIPSLVYA